MLKRKRNAKLLCFFSFLIFTSGIAGCGIKDKKLYKFHPTFYDRSSARTIAKKGKTDFEVNGMKVKVENGNIEFVDFDISIPIDNIQVSDADVIGFSSDIQKALRTRMDTARRVRLSSGSLQVLAAAVGATLGLITEDVTTAAIFAAISAVIPELQNIYQARERSDAYSRGLELIQDADARYYKKRTESGHMPDISATHLTEDGAQLLSEIVACIKLVDKALIQTIPTIDDLKAATGTLEKELGQIKLAPKNFNIASGGTHTVRVINSLVNTYSVSNIDAVSIENTPEFKTGTDKIEIKGVGIGTARVHVYNASGQSGHFDVTVGTQIPTANAGSNQTVKVSQTVTLDGSKSTDPHGRHLSYIWKFKLKPSASKAAIRGEQTATFVADQEGDYEVILNVKNDEGYYSVQPSKVTISAKTNKPPTANAGSDKTVSFGTTVTLDGSQSTDEDDDKEMLTYEWKIEEKPSASTAKLSDSKNPKPTFTADVAGEYKVSLTVSDGISRSSSDTVLVSALESQ